MNPRSFQGWQQQSSYTWCTSSRKARKTKNTYKTFAWLQIERDRSFEHLLWRKKTRRKNETVTYKVAGVARLQKGKVSANYVDDNEQAAK